MIIHHLIRALSICLAVFILAACDSKPGASVDVNTDGDAFLALTAPRFLIQSREIDPNELRLVVLLGEDEVTMNCDANGQCSGSAMVPSNSETLLVIAWFGPDDLQLAEARETITTSADDSSLNVEITEDDYDTASFDEDDDGISNLKELDAGTDPTVPDGIVVDVPVTLTFELPAALASASNDAVTNIDAVASVGQVPLVLTRAKDVWTGTTTAAQGGEIFVRVTIYASSNRLVTVAARTLTQSIESDAVAVSVSFGASDYETNFNSDGDGQTNIQEIVAGTDPLDAGDPATDPCDISQFQSGCEIDTDEDGTPDSIEGLNADTDGDGIADWRESALDDADDDGVSDQEDPANNDPCVPDSDSAACEQTAPDPCEASNFAAGCDTDTDSDGIPDSVEGATANEDGDSLADWRESAIADADGDGVPDQEDPANNDPCLPDTDNSACDLPPPDPCEESNFASGCTQDSDGDGMADSLEGASSDEDGDGDFDYLESATDDADEDGVSDQEDPANLDPCEPDADNPACETVEEQSNGNENGNDDDDDDDDEDEADDDEPVAEPCDTSDFATGCETDSDGDDKSDSVETEEADSDDDGLPDYQESSILDSDEDTVNDEEDPSNLDPCIPDAAAEACEEVPAIDPDP